MRGKRRTTIRSPGRSSQCEWLSKCTRASAQRCMRISICASLPIVIGRFDSVCGHTGTIANTDSAGCRIGPPAESAYAVEPVGVATIRPSARRM